MEYSPRICLLLLLKILSASSNQFLVKPNIIVFMVDNMGWNDVGFHGSNEIPTPNIDALAYNGIILNRHYVLPSCTPSRAAFFSGKYPIRMGLQGGDLRGNDPRGLPLGIRILPSYLRDRGYATRLLGKWHLGYPIREFTPLYRGFDSFLGFYNGNIDNYNYYHRDGNLTGFDLQRGEGPAYDIHDTYVTRVFTDEAIKIIDHHDITRPLYLHINHAGFRPPLDPPHDSYRYNNFSYLHGDRRKYAMMVSEIDRSIGRIVSALGDHGMLTDSIIVFLTDTGAPTNEGEANTGSNWPLRGGKDTLYEGGVRGVAAIWSPRINKPALVSNNLMHMTDWLPTLYSASGGDISDLGKIDGIDQWNHLSRDHKAPRESLLINCDERKKTEAAIHQRYKLIHGYSTLAHDHHYFGSSGKNRNVPPYNHSLVSSSAFVMAIHSHVGHPVTPQSRMAQIREEARILSCMNTELFKINGTNPCVGETECLFDIFFDPCEIHNIASHNPKIVLKLNSILERYEREIVMQADIPQDLNADPHRYNNTWGSWVRDKPYDHPYYSFNSSAATVISTLAVCAHIGMVLLIVGLRTFI
ncbi:arylsulfatase B-like [Fopius arisanus]|uniref:Arsb_1 protein n=1 Tax=Fopius arisanus TaxID=64838 RepID=A0A0C9RAX1_9HYME|nr:PREDICTED: arylsulfatase B-like [Fopius arisanus]